MEQLLLHISFISPIHFRAHLHVYACKIKCRFIPHMLHISHTLMFPILDVHSAKLFLMSIWFLAYTLQNYLNVHIILGIHFTELLLYIYTIKMLGRSPYAVCRECPSVFCFGVCFSNLIFLFFQTACCSPCT